MNESGNLVSSLLPFLLIIGVFYFLILRPQRRRAQEAATVRSSLQVGAEVITTSGLYGTVSLVDDDAVLLEVAPGVTNRYAKAAVARVLSPDAPDADDGAQGSGATDGSGYPDGFGDDPPSGSPPRDEGPTR